jgi:hypothetical protein
MIAFRSVLKTLLKCNHLPFKTLKEWEDAQKDEPLETLETLQKSLTREIKRKKGEARGQETCSSRSQAFYLGYPVKALRSPWSDFDLPLTLSHCQSRDRRSAGILDTKGSP